ncbi:apoptosis regulator BAX-like isoform X1 [Python bivittatus]|uniref:Apoptosis regulator BAX-like isoform X1 n=2 Tax=Python bivittatus TaxID=176946 RepID=A0A9F3W0K6_PYTBI|nr:apoptosis regulator BAX-like isoform X1 [Python bivittatus]
MAASIAVAGEQRLSDNISCILRIGKALLCGLIKTLWQQYAACPHHLASLEQPGRDNMPVEQVNEEDVSDSAQVYSLQEHMLRILQELRNNAEITRMAERVIGEKPLQALAEISDEMFATGINWGRIVVFFYFTYKVITQSASSFFMDAMDWAMNFLRDRLAAWIQQQGGWSAKFFPVVRIEIWRDWGCTFEKTMQCFSHSCCVEG